MVITLETTLQEHLNETIGKSGKGVIGAVREIEPRTEFVEGEYVIDRTTVKDASEDIREAVTSYFTDQGYKPTQLLGLPKTVSLLKRRRETIGINISAPKNPNGTPQQVYRLSILKLPALR
jgi:hypothetical protein